LRFGFFNDYFSNKINNINNINEDKVSFIQTNNKIDNDDSTSNDSPHKLVCGFKCLTKPDVINAQYIKNLIDD